MQVLFFVAYLRIIKHKNVISMNEELMNYLDQRLAEMEQRLMAGQKSILNLKEVAALTGKSESRIYHLCSENLMPYHKPIGTRSLMFDRSEVEQWMLSGYVPAMESKESMKQKAINELATRKATASPMGSRHSVTKQKTLTR